MNSGGIQSSGFVIMPLYGCVKFFVVGVDTPTVRTIVAAAKRHILPAMAGPTAADAFRTKLPQPRSRWEQKIVLMLCADIVQLPRLVLSSAPATPAG